MSEPLEKLPVDQLPEHVRFLNESEVAEMLGTKKTRIKQLIGDNTLIGLWHKGSWWVPEQVLVALDSDLARQTWAIKAPQIVSVEEEEDARPEPTHTPLLPLRGTVMLLRDARYNSLELLEWLFEENDELEQTPIEAIRSGRHHRVNQVASALGW